MIPNGKEMNWNGHRLVFESEPDNCRGCFFADKRECPECDMGIWVEDSPWYTGTPTEEGWYLLKLVDEYGRITYDANYLRKGIKGMEWKYAFFGHVIIKWQSIEDEPEVMMG